jgi:hypothetical protein
MPVSPSKEQDDTFADLEADRDQLFEELRHEIADSVTSEIRHLYEDTVRDSLARVFRLTFGTPAGNQMPDSEGFSPRGIHRATFGGARNSKKPQDT